MRLGMPGNSQQENVRWQLQTLRWYVFSLVGGAQRRRRDMFIG
ncbi:hypothetical protein BH20VER3_BH20VER3_21880 [soil metagenome]